MGWISARLRERRMTLTDLDEMMERAISGLPTATGVDVNPTSAMTLSAVFCAVRLISETMASLPLFIYKGLPNGDRLHAVDHALYTVLHDQANPEQTAYEFRETIQGHLELRGNAYAEIVRDAGGRVRELWPLHPDMVRPRRAADGSLAYSVRLPQSLQTVLLPAAQVLHVRGLGSNGLIGYSTIAIMAEVLGLGLAAQEYAARFFSNDGTPGGVLETDKRLSDPAHKRLKESWGLEHGGLSNRHRMAILEEGLKWHQIGVNPVDAGLLEARKFSILDVARMFNIPVHKLKDLERATFSNVGDQNIEFVTDAIRPRCVRMEQRLMSALLSPQERVSGLFLEHQVDGILRGDFKTRMDGYAVARQGGWLSANDIRRLENLNRISNGDIYLQAVNYVEAGKVPPPAPAPAPAPQGDAGARTNGHGAAVNGFSHV